MNILHFTSSYPLDTKDTGGIFIQQLVNFISKEHNVFVLTPDGPDSENYEKHNTLEIFRYKYFIKKYQSLVVDDSITQNLKKDPLNYILLIFLLIKALYSFYNLVKQENINVVHCHWVVPQGAIAVILRKIFRLQYKIVITSHGSDIEGKKKSLLAPVIKYALLNCDVINPVSSHLETEICEIVPGLSNINVIPMGTFPDQFISKDIPTEIKAPYILFVGRLSEYKAVDRLIEAFNLVKNSYSELELWIIGDGNQVINLKKMANNLELKNRIKFLGNIEHKYLPQYYQSAELFVSASYKEGFGLVFVEALLSKCPVIAVDTGGIKDIISNDVTGILLDESEPKLIADAIVKLLSEPEYKERLVKNGFKHAKDKFTWEAIYPKYLKMYSSLEED